MQASQEFLVSTWTEWPEDCDVLVFVKYPPTRQAVATIPERSAVIYFPVDYFQSEEHIAESAVFLRRCDCIIASSEPVKKELQPFTRAEVLEHHVKYVLPRMVHPNPDGPILWTGVRSNLPPLVEWVNANRLPRHLLVLTNPEQTTGPITAKSFGFRKSSQVTIDRWSPQRHFQALREACAAIDIKGNDFTQRRKPPTKAVDFLAAGLPFAINPDAAPAHYLRSLEFQVASPNEVEKWFSTEYALECVKVGSLLRERLNVNRIGFWFRRLIWEVLAERSGHGIQKAAGATDVRSPSVTECIATKCNGDDNRAAAESHTAIDEPRSQYRQSSDTAKAGCPEVSEIPSESVRRPTRVLLLAHVQFLASRLDRSQYLRYVALVKNHQVRLFGPGVDGYQREMPIKDAIRISCDGLRPDWIIHGLDPRASGIPLVQGLSTCGIPTAYEFGDSWSLREHQAQFINEQGFRIAFILASRDIAYYQAVCPDTHFVFLPNAVDTTIFRDHGELKQNDVLIYGSMNPDYYPLRSRISQALNNQDAFRVRHIPHPGYYPVDSWNNSSVIAGEELSRAIGQSWIAIASQSVFQVLLMKHLEIAASKTVIAGDMPMDGRAFLGTDYIDLAACKDDNAIVEKLLDALKHKDRLTEMADRAQKRVFEELSVERYATRLMETLTAWDDHDAQHSSQASVLQKPLPATKTATPLIGLMITKEDHEVFGDWCEDQLPLYDAVVCLDGSKSQVTRRIAEEFPEKIIYVHESELEIAHRTDHGLRGAAHAVIVREFGLDNWVMCCHADEFCYHDPRRVARLADDGGYDLVSWYSPHFYPHPSELAALRDLGRRRVPDRFRHFHWGHFDTELPWVEDRLYKNSDSTGWDGVTHGNVRPLGIRRPAPFHPIYRHYKVCSLAIPGYETINGSAYYTDHWVGQQHRTGLPFTVRRVEDLFVAKVPKYRHCSRFDGSFPFPWNMGDDFRCQGVVATEDFGSELKSIHAMIDQGRIPEAEGALLKVRRRSRQTRTKSIVCANLGVLCTLQRKDEEGCLAFKAALALDRSNSAAASNLSLLNGETESAPAQTAPRPVAHVRRACGRVAIISLLFNWPSTGGGTIHTKELAQFLHRAGFDVLHIFARYPTWAIGRCDDELPVPVEVLCFDDSHWRRENVISRFRQALENYRPDHVIITDSWNFKPWLAEAANSFSYVLRYQALENLCPLNNIRLLPNEEGGAHQCGRHQLATPAQCHACCRSNARYSGQLHNVEREFSGVGSGEYDAALRKAVGGAAAVLVVNPLMQAMFSPWNERTYVVPSGIDPDRFTAVDHGEPIPRAPDGRKRILFAGLIDEYMKGFHVLKRATDHLWSKRRDFELVATGEPAKPVDEYTRFVGWLDQRQLVRYLLSSDMLVFPTIAQEALGRTAVEAMAAGVPVVASRIGGLSYTVTDNLTGLLATPEDAEDLAQKLELLLDDPIRRRVLGENGRCRFREEFAWPRIIDRHYMPLLAAAPVG